jgi:hypothetical protein
MADIITKKFCAEHGIRVLDTNKRAYKHTKINVSLFQYDDDYNKFNNIYNNVETEVLYTVEISESELDRIAQFESQVFNNMKHHGHYSLFEVLMQQKEEEQYLRKKYPAVQKAYEQYSMLLKMAEGNEL